MPSQDLTTRYATIAGWKACYMQAVPCFGHTACTLCLRRNELRAPLCLAQSPAQTQTARRSPGPCTDEDTGTGGAAHHAAYSSSVPLNGISSGMLSSNALSA